MLYIWKCGTWPSLIKFGKLYQQDKDIDIIIIIIINF